jgi:hypothetical protein
MSHRAPIITLLSSSPAAARRAIELLSRTTSLATVSESAGFHRVIPWVLAKTVCRENGTRVQWLAPQHTTSSSFSSRPRHSLLAVQAVVPIAESHNPSQVLDLFESTLSRAKLRISGWLRRSVSPAHLLGPSERPVLHLDNDCPGDVLEDLSSSESAKGAPAGAHPPRRGLKEIVIPLNDDESSDASNSALWDQLSRLSRPATGLYLLPGSNLCVRPLPAGVYDRNLPPPSLVFHCWPDSDPFLTAVPLSLDEDGDRPQQRVTLRKIGHAGRSAHKDLAALLQGQYRLESDDLSGLDVRLCGSEAYQSMFCEAHESLLAGSLDQLQSLDVLGAGSRRNGLPSEGSTAASHPAEEDCGALDPRTVSSDCWIEFRANLRRPSGFFHRKRADKGGSAKMPDLPYE